MNKCLVTKFSRNIDNENLLHVGEARIAIKKISNPTYGTQYGTATFDKESSLEIIGDGNFTDYNLSENQGKNMIFSPNEMKGFRISNGDYMLSIRDKYNLTQISVVNDGISADLADFKYCSKMRNMKLGYKTKGDISSLGNLKELTSLSISGDDIVGDISNLSNLSNLTFLSITSKQVEGSLSIFTNLNELEELYLSDGKVSGDLSSLFSLSKLRASHLSGEITGDIALLPSNFTYLQTYNNSNVFTWTERPSSANIIGLSGMAIDNVDQMLQNQAKCVDYKGTTTWYRNINVKGTRTAVSDEAVETLQSKGYTVSITPA